MSKPRCNKHKRSLPYCDACKAAVNAAEETSAREEESDALQAGIGFPGAAERTAPTVGVSGEGESELPEGSSTLAPPVEDDGPPPVVEEPADWDKSIDQAEETFREGATIDEIEAAMTEAGAFDIPPCQREGVGCEGCQGECQGHADPGAAEFVTIEVTPQVANLIRSIEDAISNGQEVTVMMGDAETRLRQEGRKEVVALVRDYFADSIDTGAFKLLEYLEKKVR